MGLAVLLLCAGAQRADGADSTLTGAKTERQGSILFAHGKVEATVGALRLQGDEGIFDSERDSIELKGHSRTILPARADRTVIRYGGRALVTALPVLVAAESLRVKDGLLRLRGHASAKAGETRLEADEIDVYLNIGDGEARGNIRVNGMDPDAKPINVRNPQFPPDTIR